LVGGVGLGELCFGVPREGRCYDGKGVTSRFRGKVEYNVLNRIFFLNIIKSRKPERINFEAHPHFFTGTKAGSQDRNSAVSKETTKMFMIQKNGKDGTRRKIRTNIHPIS